MRRRIIASGFVLTAVVCIALSAGRDGRFAPASDLPRGALVYAEVADLPALVSLWESSSFKTKFLESQNFHDLQNRHLGLKLASRWREFSDAAGFPLDLATIAELADKRAALALYDIGKLEFVLIAPLSPEAFAAARFMQATMKFTEEDYDGVRVFRVNVDADRGRQKQELLFLHHRGNLVVSTSEKLLVRTLANLDGKSGADRLTGDPLFSRLAARSSPGTATVWVNQVALNNDYYFKRYWMSLATDDLKDIRAGVFSFNLEETRITERRLFLLAKTPEAMQIKTTPASALLRHIPADVPFVRLRAAAPGVVSDSIAAIFDRAEDLTEKTAPRVSLDSSDFESGFYDYHAGSSYDSFDQKIDEAEDEDSPEGQRGSLSFSSAVSAGKLSAVMTLARQSILADPLFVEFHRAAILYLGAPGEFDRIRFEAAIEQNLSVRTLTVNADAKFQWKTIDTCGMPVRQIELPMLGLSVSYALTGNKLFIANNVDFLCESKNGSRRAIADDLGTVSDFVIVDVRRAKQGFQQVFGKLAGEIGENDLFTGNIGGLIEMLPASSKLEVKGTYSGGFLEEEVVMHLSHDR